MFDNLKLPIRFDHLATDPILLVDTDILSNICKGQNDKNTEFELLKNKVTLLYSLSSIMELGFGPTNKSAIEEVKFYRELYCRHSALQNDIFVSEFHLKYQTGQMNHIKGKWIGVSPDSHNWFAAKKTLISYMDERATKPKNAKQLQTDALLSCAAWNAGAFIWTNNVKDHLLASYYMSHLECSRNQDPKKVKDCIANHMAPIFDTNSLNKIVNGETFNIYTEMKKKTKNTDIIKVLEIAEDICS